MPWMFLLDVEAIKSKQSLSMSIEMAANALTASTIVVIPFSWQKRQSAGAGFKSPVVVS
jgi:hypothetical protein